MPTLTELDLGENVVKFRRAEDAETDDQRIIRAVDRELLEKVPTDKLRQARIRALNNFHAGVQIDMAIRRAVAWARYSL